MTRANYLWSNAEVDAISPEIGNVAFNGDGNTPESIQVTSVVSGTEGINAVYLYYGTGIMGKFEKIEMLDDGLNNDGSAGDNQYGATIPEQEDGTFVRFYVEAVSANTAATRAYSPVGAEHDVYIYQVGINVLAYSDVVINELMASNTSAIADQDGEFDDWIELYNKSTNSIDLSGYYLSDDLADPTKWTIPSGTTIMGNDYLIIWTDKDTTQAGLHANFKLSADGEGAILTTPALEIADQVYFSSYDTDYAFARVPNGTGNFMWQSASFGMNNETNAVETHLASNPDFLIFPNPASDKVYIKTDESELSKLSIFTITGQQMMTNDFYSEVAIDISQLSAGLYFVKVNNSTKRLVIRK